MNNVSIKISPPVNGYKAIHALAETVITAMTANSNFPAPSPSLVTLQNAATALNDALAALGAPANRGSRINLANVRVAAVEMRNLLLLEASYVMGQLNPDLPVDEKIAFILSSGFETKKQREPQGVLQKPQNVHQVRNKNTNPYEPQLAWRKPLGLLSRKNVKTYEVWRSLTPDFSAAKRVGLTTATKFTDKNAPRGVMLYYFIAGSNTAGLGVPSEAIVVPAYS